MGGAQAMSQSHRDGVIPREKIVDLVLLVALNINSPQK